MTTWIAPTDADRLWGSVTTAMHPPHEYVAAASELQAVLTDVTHDWLHPRQINEIGKNLDFGNALADLRYAAGNVDLVRDVQHLPDQLARSGLLFAPARKLTPSLERLHGRVAGKNVSVLPDEVRGLVSVARTVRIGSGLAAQTLDRAVIAMRPPATPVVLHSRPAMPHEL